jgi:glycosyltransferase involved in cell wall biosynthesis
MTVMPRLVYITTIAHTANLFLQEQLSFMRERGFDVVVISAPGDELRVIREREGVITVPVPMEREISPLKDLVSLVRLYTVLRRLRPAIVNAGTPKAGLLGMIAAWAAGVPVRIYFLLGLRLETTRGLKRFVLSVAEHCASFFAHRVICISESLRQLYVRLGYTTEAKTCVLQYTAIAVRHQRGIRRKGVRPGKGSSNGIHGDEITQTPQLREQAQALRARLGIPDGAPVIGFVGRLTRDKGVAELLDAFDQVLASFPEARLLMLGRFEDGDPIPESYVKRLRSHPRVVMTGQVSDTAPYYRIMDVLACPSHREGLAGPPLEAALVAEAPSVVFEATGSVDTVCDGVTGTIVPFGDVALFACALEKYLTDDFLRREHGQAAHKYVLRYFSAEIIHDAIYREYVRLLKARNGAWFQKLVDSPDRASRSALRK